MTTITYRAATTADLPTLADLRWHMEDEMRGVSGSFDDYAANYTRVSHAEIERQSQQVWLAEADGAAIGCVILVVWLIPPHIGETVRKRGYVSSVYTRPEYRRQGISTHLMRLLMDAARAQGIERLVLWASEMGRPVYESLGFTPSRAMEINL